MNRLPLLLCLLAVSATAQEPVPAEPPSQAFFPEIIGIEFSGNAVTQPKVMRREMLLAPGDAADPQRVERARQAVQDLGLFRTVAVEQVPVDTGVVLIFTVQEKFYILPFPRADITDSGEYAYGVQLRWANLFGLNQNMRVFWEQRDQKEEGIGRETSFAGSYSIPQIFESRYNLSLSAGYTERPVEVEDNDDLLFEETFQNAQVQVSRNLSRGSPSQGWMASGGMSWENQDTRGEFAEREYGTATSLLAGLSHRDLHLKRYSESGSAFSARLAVATEGLASDYDQINYTLDWRSFNPVGARAHQNLDLTAQAGARHGGPPDDDAFELGGSRSLRGFSNDSFEGDAYYRLAAEYLRPVGRDWIRALVVLEAGNVFEQPEDASLSRIHTSFGVGLRLRFSGFVDLEIDFGYAVPLGGGGDGRIFVARP
ncbi:MAG: BamA/TamA family outer membrane protein [Panacagrimonas sp.]